jgi:glyoxylase-like metal-dependent hydrolase (beta-lactamase superfamily II)
MCNQPFPHRHDHHGRIVSASFGRFRPIGRRTFLAHAGRGAFALLTELSIVRNTLAIAIGSTALVGCGQQTTDDRRPTTVAGEATATAPEATTVSPATAVPAADPTQPVAAPTAAPAPTNTAAAAAASASAAALTIATAKLGFVNAFVLVRGDEVAIVDTGVQGSEDAIGEAIKTAGRSWADVRHVFLTHHHGDHAGSIDAVMKAASAAKGYVGVLDLPSVRTSASIDGVNDGDEVFGLRIVGTPGHTPGHIAVFDPATTAIVVGDALNNTGSLSGPNARFTINMEVAKQSVGKIAALNPDAVYMGHGEPITQGAAARLAELAASLAK